MALWPLSGHCSPRSTPFIHLYVSWLFSSFWHPISSLFLSWPSPLRFCKYFAGCLHTTWVVSDGQASIKETFEHGSRQQQYSLKAVLLAGELLDMGMHSILGCYLIWQATWKWSSEKYSSFQKFESLAITMAQNLKTDIKTWNWTVMTNYFYLMSKLFPSIPGDKLKTLLKKWFNYIAFKKWML